MRILVYPHDLGIGGSQLNAIELAAAVSRLGHEVVVFGVPGSLVPCIRDLGLEFVASPPPRHRPSVAVTRALCRLVRERGIDVVHGYEWPPALESWLVATRTDATAVTTVMSMAVADFLPRTMPLTVGTPQIAADRIAAGYPLVTTLAPPVDLASNNPGADVGVDDFRSRWGIEPEVPVVVTVTRLATELKLEGLLAAITTVGELAEQRRVRLVVVGDGPARAAVAAHAAAVNARTGSETVVLTGELPDPRAAYACADIVLGMGGSALRALAFRKPLVVQGESGFWRLLDSESVSDFRWTGWYGVGGGRSHGVELLSSILRPLLDNQCRRDELGAFSLEVVRRNYSLDDAAAVQERVYETALHGFTPTFTQMGEACRTAGLYGRYALRRRLARLRGNAARDDFNSRPVAGRDVSPNRRGAPVR